MKVTLLTIGHKSPPWLQQGIDDYLKRFTPPFDAMSIAIIPPSTLSSADSRKKQEATRLDEHMKKPGICVALTREGRPWSSQQLADELHKWRHSGKPLYLCIGGADGFCPTWLAKTDAKWSLSALTFPHAWARLMVTEQLYRAYSILHNHPYHRS